MVEPAKHHVPAAEKIILVGTGAGLLSGLNHALRNGPRPMLWTTGSLVVCSAGAGVYYATKRGLEVAGEMVAAGEANSNSSESAALVTGGILGSVYGIFRTSLLKGKELVAMQKAGGVMRQAAKYGIRGLVLGAVLEMGEYSYMRWKTRQALVMNRPDLKHYAGLPLNDKEMVEEDKDRDVLLEWIPPWMGPVSDPRVISENKTRLAQVERELRLIDIKQELMRRGIDHKVELT